MTRKRFIKLSMGRCGINLYEARDFAKCVNACQYSGERVNHERKKHGRISRVIITGYNEAWNEVERGLHEKIPS